MFPVGVALLSLGYAIAYYGVVVLKWAHDPAHNQSRMPPSLGFLLGVSSQVGKFSAPINLEQASDPSQPFGGPTLQDKTAQDKAADPGNTEPNPKPASATNHDPSKGPVG